MRLLADENFPKQAVEALRREGHDVRWVRTSAPGISDYEVLDIARREGRLLLTFDKDFGALTFQAGERSFGVVLFRLTPTPDLGDTVVRLLKANDSWLNHFSVVDERRIRSRPLPGTG
ncbi:MAG: DUF5615 family PIN-like protein [Bacteroidota bacterium]